MKITSLEDISKINSEDIDNLDDLFDWLDKLDVLKNTPELNKIRVAIENRKAEEINSLLLRVRVINWDGLVGKSDDDVIRKALNYCYKQEIEFDY